MKMRAHTEYSEADSTSIAVTEVKFMGVCLLPCDELTIRRMYIRRPTMRVVKMTFSDTERDQKAMAKRLAAVVQKLASGCVIDTRRPIEDAEAMN